MAEMSENCKSCGQALPGSGVLSWNPDAAVLTNGQVSVALSKYQGRVFDLLWRRRASGQKTTLYEIMDAMYFDDVNGGRDDKSCASTMVWQMNERLKLVGLRSIKGRLCNIS
jgi:hypothetical protein